MFGGVSEDPLMFTGRSPESEPNIGVADAEESGEEGVSFIGIKPRSVSSFLEQVS